MTNVAIKKDEKLNNVSKEQQGLTSLQKEMNRLFDDFGRNIGFGLNWMEPLCEFNAKLDVKDNDKAIEVTAELPGVELKDIHVSFDRGNLVLRGEKRSEKEESDKGYYRMERSFGSFHRVIPMPTAVHEDKATATYKDGILKILVPKNHQPAAAEKKIEVKGA